MNLGKQSVSDYSQYQNIVVGSGGRAGSTAKPSISWKTTSAAKSRLLRLLRRRRHTREIPAGKVKYIESVLANYPGVKPVSTEAFGGRMKMLGKVVLDNLDLARVEVWAEELGRKFTSNQNRPTD